MADDPRGSFDYDEDGTGPAILFVPGSCSTGAAWRPVMSRLGGGYRKITTSLPGYGRSAERRTAGDTSIEPVAEMVEAVVDHAGAPVHLVGHSFGGLAGLAVALRGHAPIVSLTILEAPAPGMLSVNGLHTPYAAFRAMTDGYIADHAAGNREAIAAMIDFYGGARTFASWPLPVRDYAVRTTPSNILDWRSAYAFEPDPDTLAGLALPVMVAVGERSHPSVVAANRLIGKAIPGAQTRAIEGASHFMIATHPQDVADLIAGHIARAEASA